LPAGTIHCQTVWQLPVASDRNGFNNDRYVSILNTGNLATGNLPDGLAMYRPRSAVIVPFHLFRISEIGPMKIQLLWRFAIR
jgi:hypothetical protein